MCVYVLSAVDRHSTPIFHRFFTLTHGHSHTCFTLSMLLYALAMAGAGGSFARVVLAGALAAAHDAAATGSLTVPKFMTTRQHDQRIRCRMCETVVQRLPRRRCRRAAARRRAPNAMHEGVH